MKDEKICDYCRPWCARTTKKRDCRLHNIRQWPDIMSCPKCGGTDWATTDMYIIDKNDEGHSPGLMFTAIFAAYAVLGAIVFLIIQIIKLAY